MNYDHYNAQGTRLLLFEKNIKFTNAKNYAMKGLLVFLMLISQVSFCQVTNKPASPGGYVYFIKAKTLCGEVVIKDNFLLIR